MQAAYLEAVRDDREDIGWPLPLISDAELPKPFSLGLLGESFVLLFGL